jgi:hypothetical protein
LTTLGQKISASSTRITQGCLRAFFDVTLIFGAILPPTELSKPPYAEERVGITMSWEHLRALRDVLTQRLDNYESQIGAIRKPDPKAEFKPNTRSRKRKPS